ncbi:MAG: class E sortase [Actinomycetota bacterium]|nr:class E sortase [Actinomycetota bacterium]
MKIPKARLVLRAIGILLILASISIYARSAYTDLYTSAKQRQLRNEWERGLRQGNKKQAKEIAAAHKANISKDSTDTTDTVQLQDEPIPKGKPFARLVIPKIKLDVLVLQGTDEDILALGPGHMEDTEEPGEIGNVVISGHRVTYSHPFYYLNELQKGDVIYLYAKWQKFTYYVTEQKVVSPNDVSVIQATKDRTLTLTTCNPRYSAATRLIVIAKCKDKITP